MTALAAEVRACGLCEGMNIPGVTQSAAGYGSVQSPVAIVGQSLCEPCMETQIPFTGGSGQVLDDNFAIAGITKERLFITNAVHCHPPANRRSLRHEIEKCSPYLHRELEIVLPKLIIGLGRDAERALRSAYREARVLAWPFSAPRTRLNAAPSPDLLFAKHPSWIKRQHDADLEQEYVTSLARALDWGFRDRPRPAP
jgi:uracil-DNA glycosylase